MTELSSLIASSTIRFCKSQLNNSPRERLHSVSFSFSRLLLRLDLLLCPHKERLCRVLRALSSCAVYLRYQP